MYAHVSINKSHNVQDYDNIKTVFCTPIVTGPAANKQKAIFIIRNI